MLAEMAIVPNILGCEALQTKDGVLVRAPALPASIIVTIGLKLGKEVFHLLTGKNTGNNCTHQGKLLPRKIDNWIPKNDALEKVQKFLKYGNVLASM